MTQEEKVYRALNGLGIAFTTHHHEAVFTAEQALTTEGAKQPGLNVKNLVILDKKTGDHYMVILEDEERMDFKEMRKVTGWSNKVTFAAEEDLLKYLGVPAGSCSVFGILNDEDKHVTVVLSRTIASAGDDELISFHPNINTATVTITIKDLRRFLAQSGNRVLIQE